MNLELIAQIILVMINAIGLILAWWVLRSGSKKELKQWFFFMTLFILFWSNFSYFASRVDDIGTSLIFYKLNWASVSLFLPSFFYFYVIHFLHKDKSALYISSIITGISVLLFITSIFSNLVIKQVVSRDWGNEVIFGPLGDFFNIFSAVVAFIVVFYSLHGYRSLSDEMKAKLQFFLCGVFIFIGANLIFNVGSQILFQSVEYQFLGDFSSIFLLGFTAYATIQHRLFDVKVIATEGLSAVLLIVLFSRIFTSQSYTARAIDIIIFLVALTFSALLIRSVKNEVQQKQRLQELTEQLKELDARKDEFLSIATHELRAPMTAIKGYISMLLDGDAGKLPVEAESFLKVAQSSTDRLIRLVNNMLNVARIEQGRQVYQLGIVNLGEVLQTVFGEFKIDAEKKKLQYLLTIAESVNDSVYVDLDRIHEVVANLISNAVKYTDSGKVEVKMFHPTPNAVRVEVVDTGRGIGHEDQQQIFQKYYRVEDRMERKTGTGLGLYIAKVLVEKFNGTIGFHSEVGKGSVFWFELPLVTDDANKPKVIT